MRAVSLRLLDRLTSCVDDGIGKCVDADHEAELSLIVSIGGHCCGERNAWSGRHPIRHIHRARSGVNGNVRCPSLPSRGVSCNSDGLWPTSDGSPQEDETDAPNGGAVIDDRGSEAEVQPTDRNRVECRALWINATAAAGNEALGKRGVPSCERGKNKRSNQNGAS